MSALMSHADWDCAHLADSYGRSQEREAEVDRMEAIVRAEIVDLFTEVVRNAPISLLRAPKTDVTGTKEAFQSLDDALGSINSVYGPEFHAVLRHSTCPLVAAWRLKMGTEYSDNWSREVAEVRVA